MEDGGAGGDNHSDCDSDKLGNGKLYALKKRGRIRKWVRSLCVVILFFCVVITSVRA